MTHQVMEVPASVLKNICADLPCSDVQCENCVSYDPKPGDELILRVIR
jgi:hypothetical protein